MLQPENLSILIIDDDELFHRNMELSFNHACVFSHVISEVDIKEGIEMANENPGGLQLILLDLDLSGNSNAQEGLDLIPTLLQEFPSIPVIIVTKANEISLVVEAIKRGAKDFLYKPDFDQESWLNTFRAVVHQKNLQDENVHLKQIVKRKQAEKIALENASYPFIGQSPLVEEVRQTLRAIGQKPHLTVLLTGETGVGKEVAARYMHQHSSRSEGSFVPVHLSSINKEVLESTLFGHEKGAYTDASKGREGYFQQANGGILFLDEIGEINKDLQVKLLRFLEDHTIRRLGDDKDIQLDVQVITATNKNLKKEVKEGRFREDLYFRLKNFEVSIPALRNRKEDIPLIISHYLGQSQPGKPQEIFEPGVWDKLLRYNWPGNIRELRNSIESMGMKREIKGLSLISLACIPEEIRNYSPDSPEKIEKFHSDYGSEKSEDSISLSSTGEKVAYIELKEIDDALKKTYGQKSAAAALLDLNLDKVAYRVKKHHKDFPGLTQTFIYIQKHYAKLLK